MITSINEFKKINEQIEQMPRLSQTIANILNAQIKNELVSSQIYRGMSAWLDDKGWIGAHLNIISKPVVKN